MHRPTLTHPLVSCRTASVLQVLCTEAVWSTGLHDERLQDMGVVGVSLGHHLFKGLMRPMEVMQCSMVDDTLLGP